MKKLVLCLGILLIISNCMNTTINTFPSPSGSPTPSLPNLQGSLEGRLTIGPLCPLEPCQISDEQKRLAYEARKIQIYKKDSSIIFMETIADYKTEIYKFNLPRGNYTLKVTNGNLNNFEAKEVNIKENAVTQLDIDIDTGIR